MSRGNSTIIWRPVAVWAAVTAGAVAAARTAPEAWQAAGAGSAYDRVEAVLVAACTTGLALALAWLWLVTTVTVAGLLTGRTGRHGGATRRLVLLACGAAVVAGTTVPAAAAGGDGRDLLVGLALPERAVAPAQRDGSMRPAGTAERTSRPAVAATPTTAPKTYVVRPGDSLWSIARDHPGGTASVDQHWRAIWQANREVVGDDPNLIIPGQALRLPVTPSSDGDR